MNIYCNNAVMNTLGIKRDEYLGVRRDSIFYLMLAHEKAVSTHQLFMLITDMPLFRNIPEFRNMSC